MLREKTLNIQVLPSAKDPSFYQRESGVMHTPYSQETILYSLIEQGDVEQMKQLVGTHPPQVIVAGHLSDDPLRQMQYLAVCCVTLAIRAAIRGGLNEMTAYNLSDSYIMYIDRLAFAEEVTVYLERIVLELTELVHKNARRGCPVQIRKCLAYIDEHLHETIRLTDLARITDLNKDYLAKLFRKHVGKTVQNYIEEKKMEAAAAMLRNDCDEKMLAYYLGFCSQTYFITRFRKVFGMTPHKYASLHRSTACSVGIDVGIIKRSL